MLLRKNRPQWLHIHHTPVRSFTASIRSLAYNNPHMLVFPQQPHDPYLGLPSTTNHFKCYIDPPKGARVSPFAWNWAGSLPFWVPRSTPGLCHRSQRSSPMPKPSRPSTLSIVGQCHGQLTPAPTARVEVHPQVGPTSRLSSLPSSAIITLQ